MFKDKVPQAKKTGAQSAQLQPDFNTRFQSYIDLHAHALFSSLGRLTRSPAAFILTLLVLAVSIALSSSFYLLVKNFQQLTGKVEASNQISLFLKPSLTTASTSTLLKQIQGDPLVQSVKLITPEQAVAEFKANSDFGDALDALGKNPLPAVLEVLPKNTLNNEQDIQGLQARFEKMPGIDFAKSDLQWLNRLRAIIVLANRFVLLLSILFGFAVLLIIGNTIRLELQDRREEVFITKLVGATNAFIRRPFLYTGFWLGFLGSISAWFIVTFFILFLREPILALSAQYSDTFTVVFFDYTETFGLIGLASFLGVLGAWLVLGSQLNALNPE